MSAFTSWTGGQTVYDFYYVKDIFTWFKEGARFTGEVKATPNEIPDGWTLKKHLDAGGYGHGIFLHCMCGAFGGGPKILRLTNVDFEVLEKIDLTINISDYKQPFETMIVEWPEGYSEAREIRNPRAGQYDIHSEHLHEATHRPLFSMIRHDPKMQAIFITVALSSHDVYNTVIYLEDKTIEEELRDKFSLEAYEHSLPITDEERRVYLGVMRAALNACLYVNDFGHKREGPDNPKHHTRLQHFVDVARKSKDPRRLAKAQRELKSHPIVYSITQDVRLKVRKDRQRSHVTGRHVEPHWRRGHHRQQRHGKGLTEKKRIWIFPTQVNWNFFDGDSKDTSVILHD
jgi:hypothetical protein